MPSTKPSTKSQKKYRVSGTLIGNSSGAGQTNLRIEAWDKDLLFNDFLAEARSDTTGHFFLEFSEDRYRKFFFDRRPDLYFKVFRGTALIHSTQGAVLWNLDQDIENLVLEVPDGFSPGDTSVCQVTGRVTMANGKPAAHYKVVAFDIDLRRHQPLGRGAISDAAGFYRIDYEASDFAIAERGHADLEVRVFAPPATEDATPIATSARVYDAPSQAVIDVVIGAMHTSDFDEITQAVMPLLVAQGPNGSDLDLIELMESDIVFLHRETGLSSESLRLWIQAWRSAVQEQLLEDGMLADTETGEAMLFFAWYSEGGFKPFQTLIGRDWAFLMDWLDLAIGRKVIDNIFATNPGFRDVLAKRLLALHLALVTTPSEDNADPNLGSLFDVNGPGWLTPEQRGAVASLLARMDVEDTGFIVEAEKAVATADNARLLRRTLRLARLTGSHVGMMQELNTFYQSDRFNDSLDRLVHVTPLEWQQFTELRGRPPGSMQTAEQYAVTLERSMERVFPSATLRSRIDPDLDKRRFGTSLPAAKELHAFLTANPDFDIDRGSIEKALATSPDSALLKPVMLPLQRFRRLGADWNETANLYSVGMRTTAELIDAGPRVLSVLLSGDDAAARGSALHAAAVHARDASLLLLSALAPRFNPGGTAKFSSQPQLDLDALKNYPNIQSLFGEQSSCACASCLSVLSPAAYFVDLLQLLRATSTEGDTGYAALMKRRPDLADIELSCENSETEVPQIDISLEILENALALPLWEATAPGDNVAAWFASVGEDDEQRPNPVRRLLARTTRRLPSSLTASREVIPVAHTPIWLKGLTDWMSSLAAGLRESVGAIELPRITRDGPEGPPPAQPRRPRGAVVNAPPRGADSAWTVRGGGQRWSLRAMPGGFRAVPYAIGKEALLPMGAPAGLPVDAQRTEAAWAAALDVTPLSEADKQPFKQMAESPWDHRDRNLPYCDVTHTQTLLPGHRWKVVVIRGTVLSLRPDDGSGDTGKVYMPTSDPDHPLITITVASMQSLRQQLEANEVPSVIRAALPDVAGTATQYRVETSAGHFVVATGVLIDVTLQQPGISLDAIAYQAMHASSQPLVEPEYQNPEAYRVLQQADFPWSLPFDLDATRSALTLPHLGFSALSLTELLSAADPWDAWSTAAATYSQTVLGITPAEEALIGAPATEAETWRRWGLELVDGKATVFDTSVGENVPDTPLNLLRRVSLLLQQSGLSFEQLQDVLQTSFITSALGGVPLNIVPPNSCKTSEMSVDGLQWQHLDRIHRLVRLWRHTPWSVHELDLVIQAGGSAENGFADTLRFVAAVRHLQDRLALAPEIMASCWITGAMPAAHREFTLPGQPQVQGLYERVFQSLAVANPPHPLFKLNDERLELDYLGTEHAREMDGDVRTQVAAALRLAPTDLDALLTLLPDTELRIANLRRLLSMATLASALALTPRAFVQLSGVYGTSPTSSPLNIEQFADLATLLAQSGFSTDDLAWLLLNDESAAPATAPSATRRAQLLRAMFDALATASLSAAADDSPSMQSDINARRLQTLGESLAAALAIDARTTHLLISRYMTFSGDSVRSTAGPRARAAAASSPRTSVRQAMGIGLRDALLEWSPDASDPAEPPPANLDMALQRIFKAAHVLSVSNLVEGRIDWLSPLSGFAPLPLKSRFDIEDLFERLGTSAVSAADARSLAGWRRVAHLSAARQMLAPRVDVPATYLEALSQSPDRAREQLAEMLASTPVDVKTLMEAQWGTGDAELHDPIAFCRLIEALGAFRKAGASVDEAARLAFGADEDLGRRLLSSRLGGDKADAALMRIADAARQRQRDALVAALVQRESLRQADQLYEYFLVDNLVSKEPRTTRLLQATQSVQLFVQRCLLGQEKNVTLSEQQRQRWAWMSSYRVWEANRKVFLYPENWLHPELREDQSQAFEKFRSSLMQDELNDDTLQTAAIAFLKNLSDTAKLEVCGLWEEHVADGSSTLYAIGRSPHTPHTYFWRECLEFGKDGMRWSGWRSIEANIEGTHVLPCVIDGRLVVAWFPIKEVPDDKGVPASLEVSMRWAQLLGDGWKTADEPPGGHRVPRVQGLSLSEHVAFRLRREAAPKRVETLVDIRSLHAQGSRERLIADFYVAKAVPMNPTAASETVKGDGKDHMPHLTVAGEAWVFAKDARGTPQRVRPLLGIKVMLDVKGATGIPRPEDKGSPTASEILRDELGFPWQCTTGANGAFDFKITMKTDEQRQAFFSVDFRLNILDEVDASAVFTQVIPNARKAWYSSRHVQVLATVDAPSETIPSNAPDPILVGLFEAANDRPTRFQAAKTGNAFPTFGTQATASNSALRQGSLAAFRIGTEFVHENIFEKPARYLACVTPVLTGSATKTVWHLQDKLGAAYFQFWSVPVLTSGSYAYGSTTPMLFMQQTHLRVYSAASTYFDLLLDRSGAQFTDIVQPSFQQIGADVPPAVAMREVPASTVIELDSTTTDAPSFEGRSPTAIYNWELFFHLPWLVADTLSRQQKYSDADRWLRLIFDPVSDETPDPDRPHDHFWRFLPFRGEGRDAPVDDVMAWLANPGATGPEQEQAKMALHRLIESWKANPFKPHEIARTRRSAYQWRAVLSYVENLVSWGDQLFARGTRETVNEAVQLYVLAGQVLGPRSKRVQRGTNREPATFRSGHWDADFSNAWQTVADHLPLAATASGAGRGVAASATDALQSLGNLYFCIPANDALEALWDRLEDRLFKIRHSLDIEGTSRQLPLFDPPIDPDLLVRATAAGMSISDIVADITAPLPHYRFQVWLQKAIDLCSEVKAFGASVLSALEKRDGEQLALLRAGHEADMLRLVLQVRQDQVREADNNLTALKQSRKSTEARYVHYQTLLGNAGATAPRQDDPGRLEFVMPMLAQSSGLQGSEKGLGLLVAEQDQLARMVEAHVAGQIAAWTSFGASVAHILGSIDALGVAEKIATGADSAATGMRATADLSSGFASRDAIMSSYQRRRDDWKQQSNAAVLELRQLDKQHIAAEVRLGIAKKEVANTEKQIAQSGAVFDFMRSKFTNQQLYGWMEGQIAAIHFQAYTLAHDAATRAETAFRRELATNAISEASFIKPAYWDSIKRGLLAGEQLGHDLKRMDAAYLERNQRELELTRHVSLRRLAPDKLLELRATGQCDFTIPEWLFDLECPGHYMRRLKAVSLSIPCVVGPYGGVHCRVMLKDSAVRRSNQQTYSETLDWVASSSKPFVTSGASNDSGLFETNLRDERYLPFEGEGAISRWSLKLSAPADMASFDHETISDVVLHLRYTAQDEPDMVEPCIARLRALFSPIAPGIPQSIPVLIDARVEYPSEWIRAVSSTSRELSITVGPDCLPYWARAFHYATGRWVHDAASASSQAAMKFPVMFSTIVPASATSAYLLLEATRQQIPPPNLPGPIAISAPPLPADLTKPSESQQPNHELLAKSKGSKHRRKR